MCGFSQIWPVNISIVRIPLIHSYFIFTIWFQQFNYMVIQISHEDLYLFRWLSLIHIKFVMRYQLIFPLEFIVSSFYSLLLLLPHSVSYQHSLTMLLSCPCLYWHSIVWSSVGFFNGSESALGSYCLYQYFRWRSKYQGWVGIWLAGLDISCIDSYIYLTPCSFVL